MISYLKKQKSFWVVFLLCLLFFILRFPSLYEPYWYGDEGIYHVIGRALRDGRILYQGIWDNKPPLLYIIYALFNADQFQIRLFSLLAGILSVVSFYRLSRLLFHSFRIQVTTTLTFTVFFSLPVIEGNIANAENFMLPLSILAALLVYTYAVSDRKYSRRLFLAGVLISLSFLTKVVGIFDFLAFAVYLFFVFESLKTHRHTIISRLIFRGRTYLPYLTGFLTPVILTVIVFLFQGNMASFFEGAVRQNIGYVGWKNDFLIPQGLLVAKALGLVLYITVLYTHRKRFSHATLFILIWLGFSVCNAFFSGRPYTHYQLVALPGIALAAGFFLRQKAIPVKYIAAVLWISVVYLFYINFGHWNLKKTTEYYVNFMQFISGRKSIENYQAFFDGDTPRDYEIAHYIKRNTKPGEIVYIWGNSPQIYVLSNTLPPGRYTVAYHVGRDEQAVEETMEAINKAKPKYIIIMPDLDFFPFTLQNYVYRVTIRDTFVYERF